MTALPVIADYMAQDLITLRPNQEINEAMNVLLEHKISGAPVVNEDGRLVGILSKKDCLRAALEASYYREWGKPVASYMTENVETLDPGTDIIAGCEAFLASAFRRFPVVQDGRLVGQISRADMLRAMAENWG